MSLFGSTLLAWLPLRDMSEGAQVLLFAIEAGGIFYLIITDFVPEAVPHKFHQSVALAIGGAFLGIMVLSPVM